MFKKIHDAFEPIYDHSSSDIKPKYTEKPVYIREDGPDAWGDKVMIPPGAFFCRPPNELEQNTNPYPIWEWITTDGSQVLVMTLNDSGEEEYVLYTGVAD